MQLKKPTEARIKPLAAFALMGAAVLCFSLVDATAKWNTAGFGTWQIIFVSRLVPMLAAFVMAYRKTGNPLDFRTSFPKWHALRAVIGIAMIWCFFEGLRTMPLVEAITIGFAAPLFITLLSGPMLGERIGPRRWTAVAVGFIGVLIALRPGLQPIGLGPILIVISAFSYALSMVILRRFSGRESTHNIFFYGNIGVFIVSGINAIPEWVQPSPLDLGLMISVGVWGTIGGYAVIRAYRLGEASMLAPLEYTALIWSVLFDLVLFGLTPVLVVLIGAAVIIGANVYIAHREHQLGKVVS